MKLLHLCSDYAKHGLYKRLFTTISKGNIDQEVYVPVRSAGEVGEYNIKDIDNIRIHYDHILRKYHRVLFKTKINKVEQNLETIVNVAEKSLIHAHFLFSDGALALKLKNKYDIPYIVAIRNTDINFFFKYAYHLHSLGIKIMQNAEAIVFLSPAYRDYTFKKYISLKNHSEFNRKSIVVPNGINDFWMNNQVLTPKSPQKALSLLFVGDFTPNKNVLNVIKAVEILRSNNKNITLTLVGGGGVNSQKTHDFVSKLDKRVFNYVGRKKNPEELLNFYREADILVVPSFNETFGLVYIEAISQATPFICSLGQGVDGYFDDIEPGRFVNPNDPKHIASNIAIIHENLSAYSENAIKHVGKFNLDAISNQYLNLYNKHYKR